MTLRIHWTILETSNKGVRSNVFWYVKVCILRNCTQYTTNWDKTQIFKNFPWDKRSSTKNALFFLLRVQTHHTFIFNLQFLYELKCKVHVWDFPFRSVFIKVYVFVQLNAWTVYLWNNISPFKIKIIEKPLIVMLPHVCFLGCTKYF